MLLAQWDFSHNCCWRSGTFRTTAVGAVGLFTQLLSAQSNFSHNCCWCSGTFHTPWGSKQGSRHKGTHSAVHLHPTTNTVCVCALSAEEFYGTWYLQVPPFPSMMWGVSFTSFRHNLLLLYNLDSSVGHEPDITYWSSPFPFPVKVVFQPMRLACQFWL